MFSFVRRLLLRIGYRLPMFLKRRFWSHLYDGPPPPLDEENERLQLRKSPEPDVPVVLEFVGGCRDGGVDRGVLAKLCYWNSQYGTVGARFTVASETGVDAVLRGEPTGPIGKHQYQIMENRVEDGVRYLRAVAIR